MANAVSLDLIEISPNTNPPVCKILDYKRYLYSFKRKKQEAKKKQKKIGIKEMKFKINIGKGDFDIKTAKITKFINEGNKVKVSLWFKGREILHKNKGLELFEKIIEKTSNISKVDTIPKIEGKQIIMVLTPM